MKIDEFNLNDIVGNEKVIGFVTQISKKKVKLSPIAEETNRKKAAWYNIKELEQYSPTEPIQQRKEITLGMPILVMRPGPNICGYILEITEKIKKSGRDSQLALTISGASLKKAGSIYEINLANNDQLYNLNVPTTFDTKKPTRPEIEQAANKL